jgi:hypothetical protein
LPGSKGQESGEVEGRGGTSENGQEFFHTQGRMP